MMIGVGVSPLLALPGEEVFTPSALGDALQLWLRGASLTGPTVTTWTDSSAYLRHFAEATNPPAYSATGLGGQPCAVFDGVNDKLTGLTLAALSTSADLFIVAQLDADPPVVGTAGCWRFHSHGSGNYLSLAGASFLGDLSSTRRSLGAVTAPGSLAAAPFVFEVHSAAGLWSLLVDGVQLYTSATNAFQAPTAPTIGTDVGEGNWLKGKVGEVVVVSPAQPLRRPEIRAYLAGLYQS
jgi:hypothetical protein